uniref:Vesicle transport protein n=1 Tax=Triticum urartu TaxID=4572 RepID=A0A8R7QNQ1_TRIUA
MDRMRDALERVKMLVGMEFDEESAPPPPEEQSFFDDINRHCTLNTTQRLYGFATCLAAGLTCTFLADHWILG